MDVGGGGKPAIFPKMKGSGVMVSDFVEEHECYLRLSDDQYKRTKAIDPSIAQSSQVAFEYGIEWWVLDWGKILGAYEDRL